MESHYYHVDITWNSERKGVMCSPELHAVFGSETCMEVATPPQFPKGMAGVWSPEHLMTAAVSSCLMTTFLAIAENSRLEFKNFDVKSKGKLDKVEGLLMMSEITLEPTVVIHDEKDIRKAEKVLEKAERACLISNSIKSQVHMHSKIIVEPN